MTLLLRRARLVGAGDELVDVLAGRGFTTVRKAANSHMFEWQDRSMFLLPRNRTRQLSNA